MTTAQKEQFLAMIVAGGYSTGRKVAPRQFGVTINDLKLDPTIPINYTHRLPEFKEPDGPACAIGVAALYAGLTPEDVLNNPTPINFDPTKWLAKRWHVPAAFTEGINDGFENPRLDPEDLRSLGYSLMSSRSHRLTKAWADGFEIGQAAHAAMVAQDFDDERVQQVAINPCTGRPYA